MHLVQNTSLTYTHSVDNLQVPITCTMNYAYVGGPGKVVSRTHPVPRGLTLTSAVRRWHWPAAFICQCAHFVVFWHDWQHTEGSLQAKDFNWDFRSVWNVVINLKCWYKNSNIRICACKVCNWYAYFLWSNRCPSLPSSLQERLLQLRLCTWQENKAQYRQSEPG